MSKTPDSIKHYLQSLDSEQHVDGYLCLNDKQEIMTSYGWVGSINLSTIDQATDPVQSIPVLEGLLPGAPESPTVIKNAHIDQDYYFDIHMFHDRSGAWVLFIDKTRSAKLLQIEQQIRLSDDYKNDKRRTSN